jgi:hypothetical protein
MTTPDLAKTPEGTSVETANEPNTAQERWNVLQRWIQRRYDCETIPTRKAEQDCILAAIVTLEREGT